MPDVILINSHALKAVMPDIILINNYTLKATESLKIPGYRTHKMNSSNSMHDGLAIAVKTNIYYKLFDDFITDFIVI